MKNGMDILSDRRGFQPAGFIVNMVVLGMLSGIGAVVLWLAGYPGSTVKLAAWASVTLFGSGMFYWTIAFNANHPPAQRPSKRKRGRGPSNS